MASASTAVIVELASTSHTAGEQADEPTAARSVNNASLATGLLASG
jgi:hypothetical protein